MIFRKHNAYRDKGGGGGVRSVLKCGKNNFILALLWHNQGEQTKQTKILNFTKYLSKKNLTFWLKIVLGQFLGYNKKKLCPPNP